MAKLVSCKTCGEQVAKKAVKCPHCGKRRSLMERSPVGFAILVFFCALFFIAFISLASSSSGSSSDQPTSSEIDKVVSAKTTPTPEPTFQPIKLEVSNWEVTVSDFYFSDSVDASWLWEYESDENAQYAVVEMTAKNIGKEADIFLPIIAWEDDVKIELKCMDYTYIRSEILLSENALTTETLNPLVSASGIVVFNMPHELIDSDAQIDMVISADYKSTTVTLR